MPEWPQRVDARSLQDAEPKADIALRQVMRRSLTKTEIIRKREDINRIFKEGRSMSLSGMRLISLVNGLGFDRFMIIPAKHYGRAVDRNLLRRRAKEIFRCYGNRISSAEPVEGKGQDMILVVYPGKASDFSLLESGMTKLLDRNCQR